MLACSTAIITKRYPVYATGGLFGVVLAQGFGYGLIFDLTFFLRNLSVIGGLLMTLSDSLSQKKSSIVTNLTPMGVSDQDRKKYLQLFGRVLLVFLFLGFVFNGQSGIAKGFVSVSGLVACICVAVGYKARQSALYLVVVLSAFNFAVNAWWRVHAAHPQRDFLKCVPLARSLLVDDCELTLVHAAGTTSSRRCVRPLCSSRSLGPALPPEPAGLRPVVQQVDILTTPSSPCPQPSSAASSSSSTSGRATLRSSRRSASERAATGSLSTSPSSPPRRRRRRRSRTLSACIPSPPLVQLAGASRRR